MKRTSSGIGSLEPKAHHHPLLQHAQQLGLDVGRHRADLVQKQRAAARMLELAVARPERTGEGAGLVAEQLALDQAGGKGGAVDGDEGAAGAAADVVQGAGRHLLADAGVADDQHVGVGAGQRPEAIAQVDHRRRAAGKPGLEIVALAGGGAQQPVFQHEAAAVERAGGDVGEVLGIERLFDEVVGPLAHGAHGELHVAMAGDEDDRQVGVDVAHPGEERHPVHARHADVADDDAVEAGRDVVEHGLGRGKAADREAGELERLGRRMADVLLVVDEENAARLHAAASRAGAWAASRAMVTSAPPSGRRLTPSEPPKSLTML